MPRNKRNRVVSLTKATKKGRAGKEKVITNVRTSVEEFKHAFVFTVQNMRNDKFKELRRVWTGSRFMMGNNKVMAHALGREESAAISPNSHLLAQHLRGQCGLFFTNADPTEVIKFFNEYEEDNFARSGFKSTSDFKLQKGILEDMDFSIETRLRKLGLPTKLNKGKVELENDVVVCNKGDILTPDQCKILELFGVQMAVMRVVLLVHLDIKSGELSEFEHEEVEDGAGADDMEDADEEEEDDDGEERKTRSEDDDDE